MTEEIKNNMPEDKSEAGSQDTVNENKPESKDAHKGDHDKKEDLKDHKEKKKKSHQEKIELQMQELEKKIEHLTDKHLRLQAEFDNYRKRTIREKADLIKSGGESVIKNILPVIDDFERAVDSIKNVPDDDSIKQGTMLIYNKFKEFLKSNNVREIDALHQDFDVDLHEAITKIPASDDKLKGKILEVIQKGYMLNDKVIRFAKVVIGE
jgi:molecular chaperone GrpE